MAIDTRVLRFNDDDWTYAGDAERDGTVLTVDDPAELLSGPKWSPGAPNYDEENDVYTLTADTIYLACDKDSGIPFEEDDATLVLTVARKGGVPANALEMHARYYAPPDDDADSMHVDLQKHFATAMKATINDEDAAVRAQDIKALDDWVLDTWYTVTIRAAGTTLSYDQDGRKRIACDYMARSHTGTFALQNTGDESDWWLGAGGGSGHDLPTLYRKRTGTCTRTTAIALSALLRSLDTVHVLYDRSEDSDGVVEGGVSLEYKLNGGEWTAVPDGGDLSGIGAASGDLLYFRITLTNAADHTARPRVAGLIVTATWGYTCATPTDGEIMLALKEALDADGTLTAIDGWNSEQGAVICRESFFPPLEGTVSVYILSQGMMNELIGRGVGTGSEDYGAQRVSRVYGLMCACRWHSATMIEDGLTATDGLSDIERAVENLIRCNTLGGIAQRRELTNGGPYDIPPGEGDRDHGFHGTLLVLEMFIGIELT